MRCPFCQQPVRADSPECSACRLTFPRTCALVGAVPRLTPVVADTTRSLSSADHVSLKSRISGIQRMFPQLVLQVVLHQFPDEHPFSMHVFWLFNAAGFAGGSQRGRHNHSLLLALDPVRGEAAIIPGYGLEPFLAHEGLDHLLELAGPFWENGRWADGIQRVLDGLVPWLETIAVPDANEPADNGDF